ncbi:MAG TPA: histidinol phosphate phosphatase domain-containing protein [Thermomicrobiales bacterium]|nr:histidinol phosphate phosphatase domain-containing protein [Thermomicrobiales bacterium]
MSLTTDLTGVFDFHTHTFFSDGALSPMEQARRAVVAGYSVLGLTDHVGVGGVASLIETLKFDRDIIEAHWPIRVVIGVELTHVPAESIARAAKEARESGAEIVIVHGETPVEPVPQGTNSAAIDCGLVDVLAHPGMLAVEQAELAARHGVYIEITARRGHSLTNGHVARVCQSAGAPMIVNSDAHEPSDLLSREFQERVALGAGIPPALVAEMLAENPRSLWDRAQKRR